MFSIRYRVWRPWQFSLRGVLLAFAVPGVLLVWRGDALLGWLEGLCRPSHEAATASQEASDDPVSRKGRRATYLERLKKLLRRHQEFTDQLGDTTSGDVGHRQAAEIRKATDALARDISATGDDVAPPGPLSGRIDQEDQRQAAVARAHGHLVAAVRCMDQAEDERAHMEPRRRRSCQGAAWEELRCAEKQLEDSLRRLIDCYLVRSFPPIPVHARMIQAKQSLVYNQARCLGARETLTEDEFQKRCGRLSRDQSLVEMELEKLLVHIRDRGQDGAVVCDRIAPIIDDMKWVQVLASRGDVSERTLARLDRIRASLRGLAADLAPVDDP